ncbi:hypothetical protein EG329_009647 [Mollisiaceae sp. DMI_Dod_QoI]|nr:hypothetical protein EG329_009647 [Helotiales sp. DMI_Dod_QoI]
MQKFARRRDFVRILDKKVCRDTMATGPEEIYRAYCYLVEWSDGTSSWVPIRELKRSGKEGKELVLEYEGSQGTMVVAKKAE